ncbi:MAG: carboxypeptidase regulatory-like domain-containing protein [Bryobacterales bacterium]|nr:carboxypeptidase regulatory-like domain-containing protein [Bryobacterales bacterium]
MKGARLMAAALLLLLGAAGEVGAQSNLATVTGVVTDAAEAVIPGASVTVTNVETGVETAAETNESGHFTLFSLIPGSYELVVETEGFRRFVRKNIELETGQQLRLDAALEIGALTESVTVSSAAPSINLERGAVKGDVIVYEEIQDLPLPSRDFTQLAFLVPGVMPRGRGQGSFASINGARGDQTNFYVDGVSNRNPVSGGAQVRPPLDAVEEFRVETSGFSAEYGGFSGGIIGITMRSGTNELHGSVFEYMRNEVLDSRGFFDEDRLRLRRHQYGGTLGGPVVRNKSFFLVSFEGRYQSIARTRLGSVPTALEHNGDFSESLDLARALVGGMPPPVYLNDPDRRGACNRRVQRGCFPNNTIPESRLDPIALGLVDYYPLPNRDHLRLNSISTATDDDRWYQTVFKFDQNFSARDTFAVSYQKRFNNLENPFAGSALAQWGDQIRDRRELVSVRHTHTFSPTLVMEFTGGFSRRGLYANSIAAEFDPATLGLPLPDDLDPKLKGLPRVTVQGYWPLGQGPNTPREDSVWDWQIAGRLSWIKRTHTIKTGFDYSKTFFDRPQYNNVRGNFRFGRRFTRHSVGDLLLGRLQNVNRRVQTTFNELRSEGFGMFVNDDWKVSRDLTLNLGLRYELELPPLDVNDRLSTYLPGVNKVVLAGDQSLPDLDSILAAQGLSDRTVLASEVGLTRRLIDADYNNFAPRMGFAWRPLGNNRNVFRGGYGIFYQGYLLGPVRNQLAGTFPFTFNETFNSTGRPGVPPPTLANPFPTGRARTGGSGIQNVNGFDPDPPTAYMQQWNLTVERDLGRGQALEIGYVGAKGTHLQRRYNLNQPIRDPDLATEAANGNLIFPRPIEGFNNLQYTSFGSNSTYHALQASLRRRSRSGLFYRINYTFGKSIDDASSAVDNAGTGGAGALDTFNLRLDRGRSNFDQRHSVTVAGRYQLPIGRGRALLPNLRGPAQAVVGGWQLSATMRAYSGQPFTVRTANVDLNAGESVRPNRVAHGYLASDAFPGRKGVDFPWYDLTAFERVPCIGTENRNGVECVESLHGFSPFQVGNSGRNILDMPALVNVNLSLQKNFRFEGRRRLQVRLDAFNAPNMTRLANIGGLAGQFDSIQGGLITRARAPRTMQASLTYNF